jgi:predicted Zn-dependent peptidase
MSPWQRRSLRWSLSLALLGLPVFLQAAAPARPEEVRLSTEVLHLDNGMAVLLVDRPAAGFVAAGWVVRVGSGDDPVGQTGVSHLLEHMLYKGTSTIGTSDPDEYDRIYGAAGATAINAFTTVDLTAYFLSVPANRLELWFWMESDRLLDPVFRGLPTELQVIAEERRRSEAAPTSPFAPQFGALFWQEHPYRWSRLGWPADVEALTTEDALRHFHTWYVPGNLTAVLVGRFDHAQVKELARRYFGRLPAAPAPVRRTAPGPDQKAETRMLAACDCQPQIELRYHTVPFLGKDAAALDVLAGVVNSRLQGWIAGAGVASEATAEQSSLVRAGSFAVRAKVAKPEIAPEQLEQGWYDLLRRLQEEPVPSTELDLVEDRLITDALRRLEDPFYLMVQLLMNAGLGDWRALEEQPRRLRAVTAADLQRVAQTWFSPENRTVALYRRKS